MGEECVSLRELSTALFEHLFVVLNLSFDQVELTGDLIGMCAAERSLFQNNASRIEGFADHFVGELRFTGYILLAFATRGWMAFPIMVLLASGGIGMPALQAMLSRQVDEERQGQLQGSLAALTSLTSIVGPLLFTAIYAASITTWNGWAWIAGAALYLLCLPALRRGLWSGAGQRADR